MDTWEEFFRAKSERRAKAKDYRAIVGWVLTAIGFLVLMLGLITLLNGLY